jgi:hypothetical protein
MVLAALSEPYRRIIMFTKQHYYYLLNTVLSDPDVTDSDKINMMLNLGKWFKRDFDNFNIDKWRKAWDKH